MFAVRSVPFRGLGPRPRLLHRHRAVPVGLLTSAADGGAEGLLPIATRPCSLM